MNSGHALKSTVTVSVISMSQLMRPDTPRRRFLILFNSIAVFSLWATVYFQILFTNLKVTYTKLNSHDNNVIPQHFHIDD